ncbi:hypothetical protein [Pumilibacter muris]|uniref:hypothetical protein n=1 Tax=Pumilibacter muris TaxID=2941510 RepID=UPI0020401775|nr:hypothetical protein [Pumilibacter muris]
MSCFLRGLLAFLGELIIFAIKVENVIILENYDIANLPSIARSSLNIGKFRNKFYASKIRVFYMTDFAVRLRF